MTVANEDEWAEWLRQPSERERRELAAKELAASMARVYQGIEDLFATGGEMLISNSI